MPTVVVASMCASCQEWIIDQPWVTWVVSVVCLVVGMWGCWFWIRDSSEGEEVSNGN